MLQDPLFPSCHLKDALSPCSYGVGVAVGLWSTVDPGTRKLLPLFLLLLLCLGESDSFLFGQLLLIDLQLFASHIIMLRRFARCSQSSAKPRINDPFGAATRTASTAARANCAPKLACDFSALWSSVMTKAISASSATVASLVR